MVLQHQVTGVVLFVVDRFEVVEINRCGCGGRWPVQPHSARPENADWAARSKGRGRRHAAVRVHAFELLIGQCQLCGAQRLTAYFAVRRRCPASAPYVQSFRGRPVQGIGSFLLERLDAIGQCKENRFDSAATGGGNT